METVTLNVSGMTCGGCVRHAEKALRAVAGVAAVTIDLAQGTATVEGEASQDALAASVADAGYQLVGLA